MRNPNKDGYLYAVVSGASADTTIKATPGTIRRIKVWAVGAGSSKVEVYDGTAAAGTKIDDILVTAVNPSDTDLNIYCKTSIHVKTTDSGGAMRVTITYN